MNPNYLLDREFFNITTRNTNSNTNQEKEQTKIVNNTVYMDRKDFEKQKPLFLQEKKQEDKPLYKTSINMIQEDEKNKKIQNMQFNPYMTQYRMGKNMDRIGYENNNQKEQLYYKPFERNNLRIENKNLNKLDFVDKDKKSEYYKNLNLKKFNPNINYKDFIN